VIAGNFVGFKHWSHCLLVIHWSSILIWYWPCI